jgi:hypothetical protein
MKKWNTGRLALYGAAVGCMYGAVANMSYWTGSAEMVLEAIGGVVGGGVGGAAVVAIVSGVRNLLVR